MEKACARPRFTQPEILSCICSTRGILIEEWRRAMIKETKESAGAQSGKGLGRVGVSIK
jgi:hypothetical protein